MAGMTVTDEL